MLLMLLEYFVDVLFLLSEKSVEKMMGMRSSWLLNMKTSQTEEHCSECSSGFEKVMFMELFKTWG